MAKKDVAVTILSVLLGIAVLVILIMSLNNYSLSGRVTYMQEEMEWACYEGTHKECITDGKMYFEYGEDETYAICDTDRKEYGTCLEEGKHWRQCETGQWAYCIDEDKSWTTCEIGQQAKCIKEDKYGIISSAGYVYYCDVGETSTCIDWDKYTLCLQ